MKSRFTIGITAALIVIAILVALVYMSMNQSQYKVKVCITFDARQNCGTAAAATREQALVAATRMACATISSGVTDSIACSRTKPDSEDWISE